MRFDLSSHFVAWVKGWHCSHYLFWNMVPESSRHPMLSFFSLLVFTLFRPASTAAIFQSSHNVSNVGFDFDCVPTQDWLNTGYVASDCQQAIRRFIHEEVFVHGDRELEFVAPGSAPLYTLPVVQTPRRYAVGSSHLPVGQRSLSLRLSLARELQLRDRDD